MSDLNNDGSEVLTQNIAEGENAPEWMQQNPADLKANKHLSQFATIGDASKALLNLHVDKGKLNKDFETFKGSSIPKLGENPTDEQRDAYYASLGRPEKPEGYELERPQMPDGMPYDEKLEQVFRKSAHDLGLTNRQTKGLHKMFNDYGMATHGEIMKSITENREKAVNLLKDTWKGDAYKENVEKAFRAFNKLGGDKAKEWAETNGTGDDPFFLQLFHNAYNLIGPDQFIEGSAGASGEKVEGRLKFPSMGDK